MSMKRHPIAWEILDHRENDIFRLELKQHDRDDVEVKKYRITVTRKGGDTEHEDHDVLNQAVTAFDEYCVVTGVTKVEILPPETPQQIFGEWWHRFKTAKSLDAQYQLEDEMAANELVIANVTEVLAVAENQKSMPSLVIKRVCETILAASREREVAVLQTVAGFGRFG